MKCHLCGNQAKSAYSLAAHLRSKHQVESVGYKSYPCPTCGAKFKCQFNLDKHLVKHADDGQAKPHVCLVCGWKTSSEYNLASHVSRRHDEGVSSHLCNFCGKTFKILYDLNFHVKKHHDESTLCACALCDPPAFPSDPKLFTAVKLNVHVRKAHAVKTDVLTCPSCGFACAQGESARLVEHYRQTHMDYRTGFIFVQGVWRFAISFMATLSHTIAKNAPGEFRDAISSKKSCDAK